MKSLILILLIFLTACNRQTSKGDQINIREIETSRFQVPDSNYVILDYKNDWNWVFKDVKPSTLSENELIEIEKILKDAVLENNKSNELKQKIYIKDKKRQYVSVINSKGEKVVWINLFCDDLGNENWKYNLIEVEDGGNCYFNLKINLNTKTYSDLYINGSA